jgi:hypothetical protein
MSVNSGTSNTCVTLVMKSWELCSFGAIVWHLATGDTGHEVMGIVWHLVTGDTGHEVMGIVWHLTTGDTGHEVMGIVQLWGHCVAFGHW